MSTRSSRIVACVAACAVVGSLAIAHDRGEQHLRGAIRPGIPLDVHEAWHTWGLDPIPLVLLSVLLVLYVRGLVRTWRAAGVGHGIRRWECACFAAGYAALLVAQVSPLHPLSSALFSAHMTQHEILMLVAAPLIVLGQPLVAMLRALPAGAARRVVSWTRVRWWRNVWSVLMRPGVAWIVHAAALWIWHLPYLFQAALASELVHALQHLFFVGSASLFWWADMHARPRTARYGLAVLFLFTTALHTGLLGALLAFGPGVLYPAYVEPSRAWGVDALADQQLGGLIMWVPACSLYIVAGMALVVGWLRAAERSTRAWEATLPEPCDARMEVVVP
jgi:putative membrane protein